MGCTGSVAAMDWSVESEMLALVVAQPAAAGNASPAASKSPQHHWVQVWRRSNWHWYLKHETRHTAEEVRAALPCHRMLLITALPCATHLTG
jgi:hypothetical protein